MKYHFVLALLCIAIGIEAASAPMPKSPSQQQQQSAQPKAAPAQKPAPPPFKQPEQHFEYSSMFASPGIVAAKGSQWVGSEHLYNLSPSVGIYVEIVAPSGQSVDLAENYLKDIVAEIFKGGGLTPRTGMLTGKSPLPFFHVLVMLQPFEKAYAAYCAGRLFEEVEVNRIHLRGDSTWQAITWEKQELLVFGEGQMKEQVTASIRKIATAFADLFKSYKNIKPEGG